MRIDIHRHLHPQMVTGLDEKKQVFDGKDKPNPSFYASRGDSKVIGIVAGGWLCHVKCPELIPET